MRLVLFAPLAVLFEFNFTLYLLFIAARIIVHVLTRRAGQFNEVWLRHRLECRVKIVECG